MKVARVFTVCLWVMGMFCFQQGTVFGEIAPDKPTESTFTLWQLPSQTDTIGMSYVIRTIGGKIIVVDGGVASDASYLKTFLERLGNNVEAWFISHAHEDHFDALKEILLNPGKIKIKNIYASLSDEAWVGQYGPDGLKPLQQFNAALRDSHQVITNLKLGSTIKIDGIRVAVLGVANPELHTSAITSAINNSSVVLRMSDLRKSVLFLGDCGRDCGEKLLHSKCRNKIHADYVQMAHHGQNGVDEAFYQAVQPSYCLWPTPLWLWNNDEGKGKNTGPFLTLVVRAWMDKLHIKHHYVSSIDGLVRID
jgi:beta-lactamase superfamily II metal-dependent hydrolase